MAAARGRHPPVRGRRRLPRRDLRPAPPTASTTPRPARQTLPQSVRSLGPSPRPRRVVVVGAGPVGSGRPRHRGRGHDVTLLGPRHPRRSAGDRGTVGAAAGPHRDRRLRLQQCASTVSTCGSASTRRGDGAVAGTGRHHRDRRCSGHGGAYRRRARADVWDVMTSPVAADSSSSCSTITARIRARCRRAPGARGGRSSTPRRAHHRRRCGR